MGQSTDAYLFFGFNIDPEKGGCLGFDSKGDEYIHLEEAIGDKLGNNFLKESGLIVGTHCSSAYPIHFIAVWKERAFRGYPTAIDPEKVVAPEEWEGKLQAVLDELGIKPTSECKIWLASDWS